MENIVFRIESFLIDLIIVKPHIFFQGDEESTKFLLLKSICPCKWLWWAENEFALLKKNKNTNIAQLVELLSLVSDFSQECVGNHTLRVKS